MSSGSAEEWVSVRGCRGLRRFQKSAARKERPASRSRRVDVSPKFHGLIADIYVVAEIYSGSRRRNEGWPHRRWREGGVWLPVVNVGVCRNPICEIYNLGGIRRVSAFDAVIVKAVAGDVLLADRVLIQCQPKFGERRNDVNAYADHYDCVSRVWLSSWRFSDWMDGIYQTTWNARARNKQCHPP